MASYGDIRRVQTSGASSYTANADGIGSGGRAASRQMAQSDLPYINKYRDRITRVANRNGVQPSVIAGIVSRETRGGRGTGLQGGWGDNGNAFGLMQVDRRWHTPHGEWDSEEHLDQGTKIYTSSYSQIHSKFPHWTPEQKIKGALAAYNAGAGNVKSYEGVDNHTTGKDYSNDVSARAQYFSENGY